MDSDIDLLEPIPKKSRKRWVLQDEYRLLDIWEDYESALRSKRNAHVYAKISEEMGGKFNSQEIHTKISNMVQRYRNEKKVGCPSKWEHYDNIQRIVESNQTGDGSVVESFSCENSDSSASSFQTDPLLENTQILQATPSTVGYGRVLPVSVASIKQDASENQCSSTPLSSAKRKNGFSSEILESLMRQTEQGEEQLKILRSVAEDSRNLYENLGNYLREQQENDRIFMQLFEKLVEKD